MTQINLREYGHYLSSRSRANDLRHQIVAIISIKNPIITIDLAEIEVLSGSFADELFAVLVEDKGESWFREHLRIINASESVKESILQAVRYRLSLRYTANSDTKLGLTPPPAVLQKIQTL